MNLSQKRLAVAVATTGLILGVSSVSSAQASNTTPTAKSNSKQKSTPIHKQVTKKSKPSNRVTKTKSANKTKK